MTYADNIMNEIFTILTVFPQRRTHINTMTLLFFIKCVPFDLNSDFVLKNNNR